MGDNMNANTEKTSKGKCAGFKWFVCCGPQKGRKQRKQPNEKRQKKVNCNPKNETILMEYVPPKEVTCPFKEEMHTEEENNEQMNYETNDQVNDYVNYLAIKCDRLLSYEIQQLALDISPSDTPSLPRHKKVNCNPKNETTLMKYVPLKEVTNTFKEKMHNEEENNVQMNYVTIDPVNDYTNYLAEKFERLLSHEIQQLELDTSPSDTSSLPRQKNVNCNPENETILMADVQPKEVTSPFKEETYTEEENNDHINYLNYLVEKAEKLLSYEIQQFKLDTSPSKAPLSPVRKSSKLQLPLDQHLLDDWMYKKYLDEEFKILIPYDDEETKHDTSSWTTSVLYSLPVRQSSTLHRLLNQELPEKDRWHLAPIDEMHPLDFLNSR